MQHLTAASATRATRSSTRSRACSASIASRTGPPNTGSGPRPASTCRPRHGTVPSNQWKLDTLGAPIFPGEVYQAGIGQGYDAVTPLQLINAYAALANGGTLYQPQVVHDVKDAAGNIVQAFKPKVIRKLDVPASVLQTMRQAARNVVLVRHTYNLVDLPIVVAGKSGTAEFGIRDSKGRLPFHSWFVAFVPEESGSRHRSRRG